MAGPGGLAGLAVCGGADERGFCLFLQELRKKFKARPNLPVARLVCIGLRECVCQMCVSVSVCVCVSACACVCVCVCGFVYFSHRRLVPVTGHRHYVSK